MKNNKKKKKRIIDLSRFIQPEMSKPDSNGSYTDMPADYYYSADMDEPIQDADDL